MSDKRQIDLEEWLGQEGQVVKGCEHPSIITRRDETRICPDCGRVLSIGHGKNRREVTYRKWIYLGFNGPREIMAPDFEEAEA